MEKVVSKNFQTGLTKREFEILMLIAKGKNNTNIAKDLSISQNTVKSHVCSILLKLKARDRILAVIKAIKLEILNLDDIDLEIEPLK